MVDFPHGGGYGAHFTVHAGGQGFLNPGEPFKHQLAGKVDIDRILKNQRYHGQAIFGDGTHVHQAWNAAHGHLDGISDKFFDLQRGKAGGIADNLHLHIGDIRKSVDRQSPEGQSAQADNGDAKDHNQ
ncbi:MAG: hypothetical protein BWY71_01664 [Planctomycetes bacterium ADurb.Bin412]|nr:MAG: hypothetical protein BWY71_01664 [Planctomycetes bacterium ADurb.Bin412]